MNKQLLAGVAFVALMIPGASFAQSSGTIAAEEGEEIIVTGTRRSIGIEGVDIPDTPKARTVLTNEVLRQASPGQTLLQAINIVPSVNFTNNDPFGSSGGNVRIRGFDGNRISFTWDGLPLNDTGNYAIFSNQAGDPELISEVNVNQGTTDVDSPTAASSGGTINYRTITPREEFGAIAVAAIGESNRGRMFNRVFGLLETGNIFGTGVRGFVSATVARNDKFRGPGEIRKEQFNAKLYKGFENGDFISVAGHFNRNRNAFYRQLTLAQAAADLADNGRYDYDNNGFCRRPTAVTGTAQNEFNGSPQTPGVNETTGIPGANDTSCTNSFLARINPSNTGNVRFNSRFSLTEQLTFTLDAGYQYVLANGGGFVTIAESDARVRGAQATGPGVSYNGDADTLDTVAFYAPNTTNTNRYTLLSSLRWDFAEGQSFRVAYAFDKGRHRQTGEWTFFDQQGNPEGVFGGRGGARQVLAADGYFFRGRDRFSIATLNQISAEYRGKFFDNSLEVLLGVRAPFFNRKLNQFCFTQLSNGNALCTSQPISTLTIVAPTANPATAPAGSVYAPFTQTYNYRKVLPNLGLTYRPTDDIQFYAGYAKGFSSPRTDNLYRQPFVGVAPETSDNFDVGVRYTTSTIQASLGGFYNRFQNRIVTAFDADQGISVDRNVGKVEIKGVEASVNVRPVPWFNFRGFGSYIDARLKDNVRLGTTVVGVNGATVAGQPILALTAGKKLVETPEWQYGFRASAFYGPVSAGVNFKRVTPRFATDVNDVIVPGYSVWDLDVRLSMADLGLERTFLQLNVNNVFNKQYLGSIGSQIVSPTNFGQAVTGIGQTALTNTGGANPNFTPGSPRSFTLALQVGF